MKQSFQSLRKIYRQISLVCQYDFRRLGYNNSESESYYFEYEEVEVGGVKGRCSGTTCIDTSISCMLFSSTKSNVAQGRLMLVCLCPACSTTGLSSNFEKVDGERNLPLASHSQLCVDVRFCSECCKG